MSVDRHVWNGRELLELSDVYTAREATDVMILRSLPPRYLDDEGDGYGGVPFVSLDEAIRALTTDRERYVAAALELPEPEG